jgi:hypothetical protein
MSVCSIHRSLVFFLARSLAIILLLLDLNHSSSLAIRDIPVFNSTLARNAYDYLVNVCEPDGVPNPRTLCTEGYKQAADYVAGELENIGLEPLGDDFEGSYIQTIKNSQNERWCPPGIQNVIGMVRGSLYPDQYVVVLSTLSGNINKNPQTYKTRGNDNFSYVFDSGMPVAASLAMAKEMTERDPPLRSAVFLFSGSGQGESWEAVGEREPGQKYGPYESFMRTPWFDNMCKGIVSGSLECQGIWMKGLTYWIKHPTVNLDQINIIFYADRLGSPYGFKENVLLMLGGEQLRYGTGDKTLNDFIDDVWPSNSTVDLLKVPLVAFDGIQLGYNTRSNYFTEPCANGVHCAGLKLVGFAQMAFQMMSDRVDYVRYLYDEVRIKSNNFVVPEDTFDPTSLVYFTIDNINNTYWPHFEPIVTALYDVVLNTCNKIESVNLSFDESRKYNITENDFENAFKTLDMLSILSQNLPRSLDFLVDNIIPYEARSYAEMLLNSVRNGTYDLADGTFHDLITGFAQNISGLFNSLDYFNNKYPNSEAYLDQRIGSDLTTQPEPDDSPSSPETDVSSLSSDGRIKTWAVITIIVIATVFCNIVVLGAVFYLAKRSKSHRTTDLEMIHGRRDMIHAETAADEEVASNPVPASIMAIETASYGSIPLSSIQIAVLFDSNSLAHSHTTGSIMPSPLAEEMDDSFTGSHIENRGPRVCSYGVNDPKNDTQTFMIQQESRGQVEFKDQVLSDQDSPSFVLALSLPSPRVGQSIELRVQSQPVGTSRGTDNSQSTLFIPSTNRDAEGADSSMAGGALVVGQARPQDEGSASDLQSRRASTGRPQHDAHGCDDPTTRDVESMTRSEEDDPACAISCLANQQLESSDDSSDSASESFETRLRCYSI